MSTQRPVSGDPRAERTMAKHAVMDWPKHSFTIEGQEFPWYMAIDGPTIAHIDPDYAIVLIPLLVKRYTIIDRDGNRAGHPLVGG